MLSRTSYIPRLKALSPFFSQAPQKSVWRGHIARYATAAQPAVAKLQKMPVPSLQATMEKFIRSCAPLLTAAELDTTRQRVAEFIGPDGDGPELQKMLEDRAARLPNWLEELWLNAAYLGYRDSVVVNSSPSLMLPMQNFRNESERLIYASKVIFGALGFHGRVVRHEIPQQYVGGTPHDMTQFYRILGTCRQPGLPLDKVVFGDVANPARHIVVVCKNNYFKLPVIDNRGNPIPEEQILFMLRYVVDNSCEHAPAVGLLTATDRDTWAKAYRLLKCPTLNDNVCSVNEIESCLFLVCLDSDYHAPTKDTDKRTAVCLQLLHGRGTYFNSANRWFDKTVQFIIGAKGEVGLCYEHTAAEGIPVSQMVDHILNYIETSETKLNPEVECPRPIPLPFEVDEPINAAIGEAEKQINRIVADLDLVVFAFEEYGKDVPKKFKLSPDSYIQMAMQLAYHRLYCRPAATYESASLRMFLGGRTETIRSCSIESKEFCDLMASCYATPRQKADALRRAVESHKQYTNDAMRGCGIDRHLLGLKLMAQQKYGNKCLPAFFQDKGFICSRTFLITSSQVGATDNCVMSYGPTERDGYGVCYNPLNKRIFFSVSSQNTGCDTSSEKYANSLKNALLDMQSVLSADSATRSKL